MMDEEKVFYNAVAVSLDGDPRLVRKSKKHCASWKAAYEKLANQTPMYDSRSPPDPEIEWKKLESAGIQDIVGVYNHTSYLCVVAIKQRYAGHAKQAGMAALSCSASARNGRYVVVVDEDIDPTNMKEPLGHDDARRSGDQHRHRRRLLEHPAGPPHAFS